MTSTRPTRLSAWVRRHRIRLHHGLWLATIAAFTVEAYALAKSMDEDSYRNLIAFGVTAGVLGAGWTTIGILATTKDAPKDGEKGAVPWRWPYVAGYVIGAAALVWVAGSVSVGADEATTQLLVWAFCTVLGVLSGVCVALIGLVLIICLIGVVGFGRPLLTGRDGKGEPVSRAPYVGPFVAVLGLLALPVCLSGPVAYDSPYRRDFLPLFGVVRGGVEVTHPTWLLVAQVATYCVFGGLALGFALSVTLGKLSKASAHG